MKKKKSYFLVIAIGVLLFVGASALFVLGDSGQKKQTELLGLAGKAATVFKTATCGCCRAFADYLERFGVKVERKDLPDLAEIKKQYDVPSSMESCHTTIIDGYTVEGHIPAEAIAKLLKEKPKIKGIAMPGMPSGSPGMPGPKDTFTIYELNGNDKEDAKIFLEM